MIFVYSGFYNEIKSEVGKYFKENNINPKSPIPGIWRMICVMIVSLTTYYLAFATNSSTNINNIPNSTNIHNPVFKQLVDYLVVLFNIVAPSLLLKVTCAVIFGICQALPLLHVMHDSSHVRLVCVYAVYIHIYIVN